MVRWSSFLLFPLMLSASGVIVRFEPASPDVGPFPADILTVADPAQKTGLRVNLPLPDCSAEPSSCQELSLINQLDGFNLQPRIRIRFSGALNNSTLRGGIFLIWLENLVDEDPGTRPVGHKTGINQVVFDPDTNTVYAETDEVLDQHRRYVLVITDSVRDLTGDPLEADPHFSSCLAFPFQSEFCTRLSAVLPSLSVPGRVVGASVFTTMSATVWLERARGRIQMSPIDLERAAPKSTFKISDLAFITVRFQDHADPAGFEDFNLPGPLLRLVLPDVDRISFGSFYSPKFLNDQQIIPTQPTATDVVMPQAASQIVFHAFLPSSSKPSSGYPVVIFGHGLNDNQFGAPTVVANTLAKSGFATVAINAAGHGSGSESTIRLVETNGTVTVLPAGGRSIDLNGDGVIESREGCVLISNAPLALRDCLRQTALDLMQLVRAIRSGIDLDGNGSIDLDSDRIYYAGQSLGALYGTLFTTVEPDVRAADLNVGGGSVVDIARWSPSFRSLARDFLADRTPSLLNAGSDFNEDYVLRDQAVKTVQVPGAIRIQNLFEVAEWLQMTGDPLAYAPHLRMSPLPGVPQKQVLFQFARGDRTVPNPASSNLIRAAGMRESSRIYRHDLASAIAPNLSENPHTYLVDITSPAGFAIAGAAQQQMAGFFAADGSQIPDVNSLVRTIFGNNIFETPAVLPEDLGFGGVVNLSAASYGLFVAPASIVTAGGSDLSASTAIAPPGSLPTSLGGATVTVTDSAGIERPAGLYFVSRNQINYVMPAGVMPGLATVKVARNDGSVSTGSAQVESVAPGLFSASATGAGAAAAIALKVSADGSRTSQLTFLTPIDLGSETDQVFLSLFGTGIRGRSSLSAVDVRIGGQNVPVLYAGPQNEFEGLDQVDAGPLPGTLAGRGEIEIILTVDGIPANVVTINVR